MTLRVENQDLASVPPSAEGPALQIVRAPMLDTGIGREAGFRDDAHLIKVAKAEREATTPLQREIMDEIDRKVQDAFLFGEGRFF